MKNNLSNFRFHDTLKTYMMEGQPNTKEKFLASVAYWKDGKIQDTLFETFTFLPTPPYMYDAGGKRHLKKADFEHFLHQMLFPPDYNVDALDAAVGEVKKALNRPEYRANVYLSLLYPRKEVAEFGEVNGRNLDFSNEEDRVASIQWLIDEEIRIFNSRNYQNIRLVGFYWYTEETKMAEDSAMIQAVNAYIHACGYVSMWSPYFHAQGWNKWRELGFDQGTMQPNYFSNPALPNCGGIDRLNAIQEYVNAGIVGVEMELGTTKRPDIAVFKDYLQAGCEKEGYMFADHVWYLCGGPKLIDVLLCSEDPYVQSVYHEMYLFLKRDLSPKDILTT